MFIKRGNKTSDDVKVASGKDEDGNICRESLRNVVKISKRTVFFFVVNNSKQSREYFRASILTHKPFLIRQIFV